MSRNLPPSAEISVSPTTLSQTLYNECDRVFDRECKDIIGKLLTVADATFSDPIQRKAFKDVIEEKLYDHMANFRKISLGIYEALNFLIDEMPFNGEFPMQFWMDKDKLDFTYTRKAK